MTSVIGNALVDARKDIGLIRYVQVVSCIRATRELYVS
jgi:hypothetical protein